MRTWLRYVVSLHRFTSFAKSCSRFPDHRHRTCQLRDDWFQAALVEEPWSKPPAPVSITALETLTYRESLP